jgi:hypothetical protein
MTDQEMTIRLGNYIIKLQRDISALEGVFTEYRITTADGRRREIPYREMAQRIAQEEGSQQVAAEQRNSLLQTIGVETRSSALIRGLYRRFLEE